MVYRLPSKDIIQSIEFLAKCFLASGRTETIQMRHKYVWYCVSNGDRSNGEAYVSVVRVSHLS